MFQLEQLEEVLYMQQQAVLLDQQVKKKGNVWKWYPYTTSKGTKATTTTGVGTSI